MQGPSPGKGPKGRDSTESLLQDESPKEFLFTKTGMPTLETLKHNGKIKLINYPKPDEVVTEKPMKPLNGYHIYLRTIRDETRATNPTLTFH